MKKIIFLIGILILSIGTFAQTSPPAKTETTATISAGDFMNRLVGTWIGEGNIMGLESKIVMSWENVLDGKFSKLTFRNTMKKKDGGTQVFEGNAYYKVIGDSKCQGTWFDTNGEAHPLNSDIEGNALNTVWGTDTTKMGRTIYRLLDEKKMEVIDSIKLKDGSWREFGRSVYVRRS